MAASVMLAGSNAREAKMFAQTLQSASLELQYEQSSHMVEIVSKDEDLRRIRFDMHILEDDNDELRGLLAQEEDRSDTFEKLVNETLTRAEEAESRLQETDADLRNREQEICALQAEAKTLHTTAADSETLLTEKLALTRELSVLRPELEHFKTQAASTEVLLGEKLEMQRQLTSVQCELENAKRDTKRALAKRRNTGVEIAQEQEVEDLKRELAKEKRARTRAEEAAETTQSDINIDDVRKELAREKRARQKAQDELEAMQDNTQLEDVRKDLLKEKKAKQKLEQAVEDLQNELERERKAAARAAARADGNAAADEHAEQLREELEKEKKERARAEKIAQKAAQEFEAAKAVLDDKLNQFRTKLRTTKEKLKETEAELAAAREPFTAQSDHSSKVAAAQNVKNIKKRNASQFDADATNLGTPGDGPHAKRGRKGAQGVGDKSTFSITPFLNKTMSVVQEESDNSADDASIHQEQAVDQSPIPKSRVKKQRQPLTEQTASEANIQKKTAPRQRKPKVKAPVLEIVTEEEPSAEEATNETQSRAQETVTEQTSTINEATVAPAPTKIKTKTADGPAEPIDKKRKPKIRKSLSEFATFAQEPEPEKKKKRKLGGLGKTLFDEDDQDSAAVAPALTKVMPGRALFGSSKAFTGLGGAGALGGLKRGAQGILGGPKLGATLLNAADGSGFQFSPLKRSRKNLDDTLRG